MRRSSTSSTVTVQPLSSSWRRPSTPSIGLPVSAATCSTARRPAAAASIPFPREPLDDEVRFLAGGTSCLQPFEQLVLAALELGLVELAAVEGRLERRQLAAHAGGLVERTLGLHGDLLAGPGDAAHGRERQGEQPGDQAHAGSPWGSSSSTKWNGGTGPTQRTPISAGRPALSCSSSPSKRATRVRASRKATLASMSSWRGSSSAASAA